MYEQLNLFDRKETVDDVVNKIIKLNPKGFGTESIGINNRLDFFRIKITTDQALLFIQFYFKGHFKGECFVSALGSRSCSMFLNDHNKGEPNLLEGLKKVYEALK